MVGREDINVAKEFICVPKYSRKGLLVNFLFRRGLGAVVFKLLFEILQPFSVIELGATERLQPATINSDRSLAAFQRI